VRCDYVKEFDITDKLFYTVWKDLLDKSRGVEPKSEVIIPGNIGEIDSRVENPFENRGGSWKV